MNKFMALRTMQEIEAKRKELRKLAEEAEGVEGLDVIENDLAELEERQSMIMKDIELQEKRDKLLGKMNGGEGINVSKIPTGTEEEARSIDEVLASKEYRSAFAKTLMRRKLNDAEQRALNVVNTTTATVAVDATETVDGVNNGGLLIPTDVNLSLMNALSEASPIFKDITKTAISGVVKFPYRKKVSTVARKGANKELEPNGNMTVQWAELELKTAEISETVVVTFKLEAMAVDQFIGYLLDAIKEQVKDSLINGTIYGTGNNDMQGITVSQIGKTYSSNVITAMEKVVSVLSSKLKIGAKFYISTAAAEELQFSKNSNGDYIFPVVNGIPKNFAGYSIEVDPYLNDKDIVFGNVKRYGRLNINEAMSITKETHGAKRKTEYTAYELASSAAQPETLCYCTCVQTGGDF